MTKDETRNKAGNTEKSARAAAREARLKQALRDNLRRRKAQGRQRSASNAKSDS